jgi:hypothetical protein
MFFEYLSLRKEGDMIAKKHGYGKDWRSVITKESKK